MKQLFKKIIVALLRVESRAVLKRYNPKIVGVTGNVGKTSTKDAIFVALSPFTHVRKSEKSFNSETGVPLSVLGVPNGWSNPIQWIKNLFAGLLVIFFKGDYPKWLVLEIGADAPGDIKQLASWIKPDVALITRFPEVPVHIEYFDSKEAVIEEKKELVKALKPDGILVLNADDTVVRALADEYTQRAVTYGFGDANVHGGELSFIYQKIDGVTMPIGVETVVTIGKNHIRSALMACLVTNKCMQHSALLPLPMRSDSTWPPPLPRSQKTTTLHPDVSHHSLESIVHSLSTIPTTLLQQHVKQHCKY
jgi:UDP-N-acetylmuramyl pentapeptide synthase